MARGTRAVTALQRAGVDFAVHEYAAAEDGGATYGEAVAAAMNLDPGRVFKTLVGAVDGDPVVAVVPVDRHLSLKKLARAFAGKRAAMADPADAERLTGYVVGGISPFGQQRPLPVALHRSATDHDTIFVSGGGRGLEIEIAPAALVAVLSARLADLTGS